MPVLPNTDLCPLVRTDFSDETGWQVLCREIARPVDDFRARLHFVSDLAFEGATHAQLVAAGAARGRSFLLVADREAICDPQQKVLALDILEMPGRSFRFVPSVAWSVENNLSLANMDFFEFAQAVDEDGVFRGFK
jgi:hypothetical protein